jgi:hypothetical protein
MTSVAAFYGQNNDIFPEEFCRNTADKFWVIQ